MSEMFAVLGGVGWQMVILLHQNDFSEDSSRSQHSGNNIQGKKRQICDCGLRNLNNAAIN